MLLPAIVHSQNPTGESPSDTVKPQDIWTILDPLDPGLKQPVVDQVMPPWDIIDVTGADAKIIKTVTGPSIASPVPAGKFPVWIPVTGGIIAGGAAVYFLLNEDEDVNALDDFITIPCAGQGSIRVLDNDNGKEINVTHFDEVGGIDISHVGNGVFMVGPVGNDNFSFSYTITDTDGKTASATVFVTVELRPIEASADSYETDAGQPFSGNLLTNDTGTDLVVVANSQPAEGTVEVQGDGSFTFAPGQGFAGQAGFTYTIEDICGQRTTAEVTIIVNRPPCNLEIQLSLKHSDCGLNNGNAGIAVEPPGNYNFFWSNGEDGAIIGNLMPGDYTVTVIGVENACEQTEEFTILENEADYVENSNVVPANCIKNGIITVTLKNPAGGQLTVNGTGPEGEIEFMATAGVVIFSDFFEARPGEYTFTIFDPDINEKCFETLNLTIPDATPELIASDDNYVILNTTILTGNILTNDNGLDISISGHTFPSSGTLILNPDGSFSYTPEPGFAGTVTFMYTLTDACGETADAIVSIEIDNNPCNYEVNFQIIEPDCGFSNGSVLATADPSGEYSYMWSTGAEGMLLDDISEGTYQLTITNLETNCEAVYSVIVNEEDPNYIIDLAAEAGLCTGGGDIIIHLEAPGLESFIVNISGPGISEQIMLNSGVSMLGSLFNLFPGPYIIEVYNQAAGPECSQSADILMPDTTPDLVAENDSFTTQSGITLEGNVLLNDAGLGIAVIAFTQPDEGTVTVDTNGKFVYQAPADFEGEAVFTYTIMDDCGNQTIASVVITVTNEGCNFSVEFVRQLPHCGIADGMIMANVMPEGDYTFMWSNGETGMTISGIPEGSYQVTVTDPESNCSEGFALDLQSLPPNYIISISSEPGTCIGGGDIILNLSSIGDGPFILTVEGPGISEMLTVGLGVTSLSEFFDIQAGDYQITVYDESIGMECTQVANITVENITPDLNAVNDQYTTPFETPLSDNMLDNDSGLEIVAVEVLNVINGMVVFQFDGDFTFTPDAEFSGEAGFEYVIQDACGETDIGQVTIIVEEQQCMFEPTFTIDTADCGIANGIIMTTIEPMGFYFLQWSNGETGATVEDLLPGEYNVTITDLELTCSLEFTVEMPALEPDYFSNLEIVPLINCIDPAEINFTVNGPGEGPMELHVMHPGGMDTLSLEEGPVMLGDFIDIVPGDYAIAAFDSLIGEQCTDTLAVTIDPLPELVIEVLQSVPPSTPESADGSIMGTIIFETTAPYMVMLNGSTIAEIQGPDFEITGLLAGVYDVQLKDSNGCLSNIVVVELEATEPTLLLGLQSGPSGFMPSSITGRELPGWIEGVEAPFVFGQRPFISWRPKFGNTFLEGKISFMTGQVGAGTSSWRLSSLQFQALSGVEMKKGKFRISLSTGPVLSEFAMRALHSDELLQISRVDWQVNAAAERSIGVAKLRTGAEVLFTDKPLIGLNVEIIVPLR